MTSIDVKMDQKIQSLDNRLSSLETTVTEIKSELSLILQCTKETQKDVTSMKSSDKVDPNFIAEFGLDSEEKITMCEDRFGENAWFRKNMVNICF